MSEPFLFTSHREVPVSQDTCVASEPIPELLIQVQAFLASTHSCPPGFIQLVQGIQGEQRKFAPSQDGAALSRSVALEEHFVKMWREVERLSRTLPVKDTRLAADLLKAAEPFCIPSGAVENLAWAILSKPAGRSESFEQDLLSEFSDKLRNDLQRELTLAKTQLLQGYRTALPRIAAPSEKRSFEDALDRFCEGNPELIDFQQLSFELRKSGTACMKQALSRYERAFLLRSVSLATMPSELKQRYFSLALDTLLYANHSCREGETFPMPQLMDFLVRLLDQEFFLPASNAQRIPASKGLLFLSRHGQFLAESLRKRPEWIAALAPVLEVYFAHCSPKRMGTALEVLLKEEYGLQPDYLLAKLVRCDELETGMGPERAPLRQVLLSLTYFAAPPSEYVQENEQGRFQEKLLGFVEKGLQAALREGARVNHREYVQFLKKFSLGLPHLRHPEKSELAARVWALLEGMAASCQFDDQFRDIVKRRRDTCRLLLAKSGMIASQVLPEEQLSCQAHWRRIPDQEGIQRRVVDRRKNPHESFFRFVEKILDDVMHLRSFEWKLYEEVQILHFRTDAILLISFHDESGRRTTRRIALEEDGPKHFLNCSNGKRRRYSSKDHLKRRALALLHVPLVRLSIHAQAPSVVAAAKIHFTAELSRAIFGLVPEKSRKSS